MKEALFVLCVLAVTVYLTVAAIEDYRTCEVTRWKHLIGLIPAIIMFGMRLGSLNRFAILSILIFVLLYVLAGYQGIYGLADGFVFSVLVLLFGALGGIAGIGLVIVIMVTAGISFMINHLVTCAIKKKKLFQNVAGALIPHILVGYILVWVNLWRYAV